ncbi:MAG: hypothetical protein ACI901_000384 [Octadecabacter sp.]|jgi:hypothetical protein
MVTLVEAEQIQTALKTIVKIILEGRTTDTAIITALHLQNGNHTGAAWHGAKKLVNVLPFVRPSYNLA